MLLTMQSIQLEESDFYRLSSFIMSQFGIKLPPNKKTLLQSRLQKRLKTLQHSSFKEYVDYVFSTKGQREEVWNMIDAVSTNKTDFFREPQHFEFLLNGGIEEYLQLSGKNRLSVWSAGCSSGEEPYTLAMVLKEASESRRFLDFKIMATDISESVLQHAVVGIYNENKTYAIPEHYKKKYLLRGKSNYENKVRISSQLRSKVEFMKYNLLTTDYSSLGRFDTIFCRNVMIYFERDVQHRLLNQFCKILNPGGYLFIGHSESITGLTLPLKHIRPTIFKKLG